MIIDFSQPEKTDINSLKELWLSSFEEKQTAVELFFDRCFNTKQTYVAKYNNKIVSALYLLDTSLNGKKAHYLCGASTHKDFRNKGIMGRLINFALEKSAENGYKYSLLFPANDSLYDYYQKFGYKENCSAYISEFSRNDLISFEELHLIRDNIPDWNNSFKSFSADYYALYDVNSVISQDYFALFEENNNTADIFYFDFKENNFKKLISDILSKTNAEQFSFTHNGIFKSSQKIRYGMVKPLESELTVPTDIYIGITLN